MILPVPMVIIYDILKRIVFISFRQQMMEKSEGVAVNEMTRYLVRSLPFNIFVCLDLTRN